MIYIFGHKKPDTDSVTSAIALSYLKNQIGMRSEPKILGKINKETEFVLKYFNVKTPNYLEDVKLKISDLNYYKRCYANENDSINSIYEYMLNHNITGVPLVDNELRFKGLVTSKMIGLELIKGDFTKLNTSYKNILDILKGEQILKFNEIIDGNIIAAAYRSTTFLNSLDLNTSTIMIVGDRHSLIEEAVNKKIKLLVLVGSAEIKEEHLKIAKENKVNIIKTNYDTFHTAKLIGLSSFAKNLIKDMRYISFRENDYYEDFAQKSIKLGFNNYPVVNSKGKCLGLIRITDINEINKKKIILVDHNEASQSVDGIEDAEILEIIDHHKIGAVTTNMPINFRNMTVGSTNTIIYSMFQENNVEIPDYIAGLMLSGIISDTLKFTSPTTTEYDKVASKKLSQIAKLDIEEYAKKMFKAGTDLNGKTIEEIIDEDMKIFEENNKKIAISQVITLDSEEILNKKEDFIREVNQVKNNRQYDMLVLCVTDIIQGGSYIFFDEKNNELLKEAFNIDVLKEGYYFDKCLSRKKQLVPLIMNVIK